MLLPSATTARLGVLLEVLLAQGMRFVPSGLPEDPPFDCALCPRLVAHREGLRAREPQWFNGAVPSFGDPEAWLAIVGLAPGERGANRTGRPFTGDHAGELLYATLTALGLAEGSYQARPDDGLRLVGAVITNAVHCLPPANRPVPAEIASCRSYLAANLAWLPRLEVVLALGAIAHQSVLKVHAVPVSRAPFAHGAVHPLRPGLVLVSSYHCSRYNQNTGRLTAPMFRAVFEAAMAQRSSASRA
jgi:uracil-DNA glycosylase family 4